ncbi:MAG: ATP-binding cassette domain-containing protein, partial [Planctomycetota bacterium]
TLIRSLVGDLATVAGRAHWAHGSDIGVYAQHVFGTLPEQRTVVEYLHDRAPTETKAQEVLAMAGSFLFRGDAVHKPISVLSGGERARLILAGMLLHRHTVLVLDEPTNHLDVETVDALAEALQRYRGTTLVVSHDRRFCARVADAVIEVGAGKVALYPGDYDLYLRRVEQEVDQSSAPAAPVAVDSAEERKARNRRRHELGKQVAASERRMDKYQARCAELNEQMVADPERVRALSADLSAAEEALVAAEAEWLAASEELEALG